ncbi:MAG: DUF4271 domain-containing protein [Bacteroidaceae bacterium]|nr:DUF4271 domain-containing protein [Bacteroidaceae bacterium]
MTGEPVPYSIYNDNTILVLYVLSLIMGAYTLMRDGGSILERIKFMLYYSGQSTPYNTRAGISKTGSFTLYANTILYSTIITFVYLQKALSNEDRGNLIMFAAIVLLYIIFLAIKFIVYETVNRTLFSAKQAHEWSLSYFFTIKTASILLMPLASALILLPTLSDTFVRIYLAIVGIMFFIVLSLRCFNIIFSKTFYFLDIFLYLCAIELLPLIPLWQVMQRTNLFLMIKF